MYVVLVILIMALTAFLVWASADVGSNVYMKALCRARTEKKVVSITFDDGPDAEMTPRVLAVLRKYHAKAAFFLIGEKVRKHPEIVKQMDEEGHIVANHTDSHRSIFPLSHGTKVAEELEQCQKSIAQVMGKTPIFFRPPFGVTNPVIGKVVKHMGLQTIGWSIRSLDTISSRSREDVCKKVVDKLHCGAVLLLHDRCDDADVLLEMLIKGIKEKGYEIEPIDSFLKIKAYEN